MRILIVKVSALGDVIHALPVLPYLKSADAGLEIDWMVEEPFAHLLEYHPMVSRVLKLKTRKWREHPLAASTLNDFRDLFAVSRAKPYDAVLDLQGNCKSGLVTWLSRAPRRYGFGRGYVREWPNLVATNRKAPVAEESHHITDRALAVAAAAFPGGVVPRSAGPLFVSKAAVDSVEKLWMQVGVSGSRTAVLHTGASWPTKSWHLDCWRKLVAWMCGRMNLEVFLTWGSDAERAACLQILDSAPAGARLWPKSSLQEVMALLARADIVVGGDTGLTHMAAALNTPTVSLFFVTDGMRNGPRGTIHECLQSHMECSPCLRRQCSNMDVCTRSIPAESVCAAIERVLCVHKPIG